MTTSDTVQRASDLSNAERWLERVVDDARRLSQEAWSAGDGENGAHYFDLATAARIALGSVREARQ